MEHSENGLGIAVLKGVAIGGVWDHQAGSRPRRSPMSPRRAPSTRAVRSARKRADGKVRRVGVAHEQVHALVDELFGEDVHAQRVLSVGNAVAGVIEAGALSIHAIGRGLAAVRSLTDKHAIKQVDRLVGNEKLDAEVLEAVWTKTMLAGRDDVFVSLDWTEFDPDDHSMLVLSLEVGRGRALPLVWKTVVKSALKGNRNNHEDALLSRFRLSVPDGVRVTVVADRGFSDQALYEFITDELDMDFIIRCRADVYVTDANGERRPAGEWVRANGRLRALRGASVTTHQTPVGMVVLVQEKRMQDSWCLATSRDDLTGAEVKQRYGKRFTCEETFRDVKDWRYGLGMKWQKVSKPERRDRLMLMAVLAVHLLTLLGEAGERAGLDRLLKTNTSKKRTLSLLRQGMRWYALIPNMPEARLIELMEAFATCLEADPVATVLLNA